ncbi:hypothetical protein Bbelb_350480 [Branchiostoma belcheri]|nr:hypothetical protein Bbelb_350480 [Branchiostoma belcheri]
MFAAIAKAQKEGGKIPIEKGVQKELEYWRFLDGWKGHMTWRKEKHDVIKLASDTSGFKWGGSVTTDEGEVQMGDYWQGNETEEHISIKETEALTKVLIAMEQHVRNKRVEAWVDNKNLISAWENQGSRSLALTRAVVRLWETVIGYNIDLMLTYVPSKDNPADEPSRRLSASDAKLHSKVFARIDKELGGQQGFDVDLMALPSNVQTARNGQTLKFFSPWPVPGAQGEILVANIMGQGIHGCQGGTSRTTSLTLPVSQSDVENTKDGRGGEWDERLGLGNPAASPIVKEYLKAVTGEQLQQGITPQQAKPLFLPKIIKVCQYIVQQIETEKSPIKLFIRARDQAIFKAVFFAGDRVGDLLRTRTNQVYRLTSGALLFNHVWGKTLRDGRQNVFALEKTGDTASCPVEAIDFYVDMAEYLSVNLSGGMLFRATSKQGQVLENQPTTSAVDESFKRYLEKCGIYEGERLHGSRAGCAISLHMAGASEEDVMSHVGWVTKRTASHYMKIAKVMKPGGPASKLATEHVSKAVQESMEQDNLVGLQPAF